MTIVKKGDMVQWTINGADQFAEPRKVAMVTECGGYCFVEGGTTGLSTDQITVIPETDSSEEQEEFTLFWNGPFSQWHICRFKVNEVVFNCAEQYMMASKARMFQDWNALEKIMKSTDPSDQKKYGRRVSGFVESKWNTEAKNIVYIGNHAKFTQNPTLLKALITTKGTMVEASPYDKIWGIGLHAKDPRALSRATWQGTNWLGEVLTRLRNDLMRRL